MLNNSTLLLYKKRLNIESKILYQSLEFFKDQAII